MSEPCDAGQSCFIPGLFIGAWRRERRRQARWYFAPIQHARVQDLSRSSLHSPSFARISRVPSQMHYQKTSSLSGYKKKIADLKKSRINLLRNGPFWTIMALSDR